MKNTKFFVSTLIAAAAMTATAYSEGEVISLNFTNGDTGKITETATGEAGLVPVGSAGWVNISSAGDTTLETGETVSTTYANGTWYSKTDNPSTAGELLLKGYLDIRNYNGENNWKVGVSNISYLSYDVYAYFAGDSTEPEFASISVNGQSYIGDENGSVAVSNPTGWGSLNNKATSLQLGVNALKVSDVVGSNVVLTSDWVSSSTRATLAGIQIVNTYTGTSTSVNLGGTEMAWTTSSIGSTAWTNSTADAGTYAAFNLTADTTVNVSGEGITTDAITASGSGVLTLSGNAITLIGPGVVRTDSDNASIVVNNNLTFSNGGAINGNVSLGDSGSISITGGTLFVGESIPTGGSISVSEGATLNLGVLENAVSATNISGLGTVRLVSSAGGHAVGVKLTEDFSGTVEFTGKLHTGTTSLSKDATLKLYNYAGSSLWGGNTLACDVFFQTNYQIGDSTGTSIGFSGDVTGVEGTTVTITGNATATFSGTTTFDTLNTSGTTTFSNTTSIKNLNVTGGTTTFSNTTSIKNLNVTGGTTTFSGSVDLGTFMQTSSTGTTVFEGEATVNTFGLGQGSVSLENGAVLTVTGATNSIDLGEASFMLNEQQATTFTVKNGGVLNVQSAGVSVRDGTGTLEIQAGGEVNFGQGLSATMHGTWGGLNVALSGGTLNVGGSGIVKTNDSDINGFVHYNLNTGTLGSLADAWSSSIDFALGGAVTVDTTKKAINLSGKATATEHGSNVTLSGVLSDATDANGSIKKAGAGTLTLSGANTYSGGTTIEAGTLVAAHQNALGGGDVTMAGGTLKTTQATTISGNIILSNGKDVRLDLDDALTIGWMGVDGDAHKASSINIDFGIDGKIVAGSRSVYGGGINFTDSDNVTFTIVSTTEADTYSSVAVSDLVGRVLLSATNGANVAGSGVNGIWNLAESGGTMNALKIVVENALGATLLDATATFVNNGNGTFTWLDSQSGLELLLSQSSLANGESTLTILSVPEPSAFGLLAGVGALALCVSRRRRVKKA